MARALVAVLLLLMLGAAVAAPVCCPPPPECSQNQQPLDQFDSWDYVNCPWYCSLFEDDWYGRQWPVHRYEGCDWCYFERANPEDCGEAMAPPLC